MFEQSIKQINTLLFVIKTHYYVYRRFFFLKQKPPEAAGGKSLAFGGAKNNGKPRKVFKKHSYYK